MENNIMPRMNISLTKDQMQQLKELAELENRPYSKQIVHMMQHYIECEETWKKKKREG